MYTAFRSSWLSFDDRTGLDQIGTRLSDFISRLLSQPCRLRQAIIRHDCDCADRIDCVVWANSAVRAALSTHGSNRLSGLFTILRRHVEMGAGPQPFRMVNADQDALFFQQSTDVFGRAE